MTTISGMSTTVVSSMAITSPSEGMNSTASVATSSPTLHTPIPVIVGVAVGGAIGLVLLSILLGTLCRGRRRGKHSFKNKAGGDGDMIRPSKPGHLANRAGYIPSARTSMAQFSFVSSQRATREAISRILEPRTNPRPQSSTPDTFKGTDASVYSVQEEFPSTATGSFSAPAAPDAGRSASLLQMTNALITAQSPASTSETLVPVSLGGPTAEYVSNLHKTIGELQLQVATLARAERAVSVVTKSPPPAYEEPPNPSVG